jgi:hypothetical protein
MPQRIPARVGDPPRPAAPRSSLDPMTELPEATDGCQPARRGRGFTRKALCSQGAGASRQEGHRAPVRVRLKALETGVGSRRTAGTDLNRCPSMSTSAGLDTTQDRATPPNPPFRIYSATKGRRSNEPLAGQLALAGTSSIVPPFVVKTPTSAAVATKARKRPICRSFQADGRTRTGDPFITRRGGWGAAGALRRRNAPSCSEVVGWS